MPVEGDLNRSLDSDKGPEEVELAGAVSSKRARSMTVSYSSLKIRTIGGNLQLFNQPENVSKRQKQLEFVSPKRDRFLSALREQRRHSNVQDTATLRKYRPSSLLISHYS